MFFLSSLFHFIYEWVPNSFTSVLFPVNESIWEHNKIIILAFFVLALIEKIYYKNKKNTIWAGFVASILCSILVMALFTPIFVFILKMKDNIIITFIIFFISISISEVINYKLLNKKYNPKLEVVAIVLFDCLFLINGLLTYYPLNNVLFYNF